MPPTSFLLLPLSLLSAVEGYRQRAGDTRRGIRWLDEGRSVIVRLETPDLPPWNTATQTAENIPTCLIFNFTLQDKRILLLNDVPIFPLRNAHVPPCLNARQSAITLAAFDDGTMPDFSNSPLVLLDYYREVPPSEHPNAHYNIFNTKLELDILGVGNPDRPGERLLLTDDNQRIIRVNLDELKPYQEYPYERSISELDFRLSDAVLSDRYPYYTPFSEPNTLKNCTMWSWRCSDFDQYPWYHYVYRDAFDQHGKIGSFRHMLVRRWDQMCDRLGIWQLVLMIVVGTGIFMSTICYALQRAVTRMQLRTQSLFRRRAELELERIDEAEGLLCPEGEERGDNCEVACVRTIQVNYHKPLPPVPAASSDLV
ncbi:unnamed protein product [Diplocarpon coronariae]|uniref:Uncharacterized protein n=1 Tax=Diplocarpon coronariae TaxID=2795749 RepID=A0A218YW66_9HELO|nr:hypothetical protein JHW43_003370 [Diplocarpon mali]OWP00037.1 hypothetical protein B2J93_8608 [Marssonina coronariae]